MLLSLTALLAVLFQLVGWHPALVLGTAAVGALGLWRELRSPQRRASKILEGVELELRSGRSLESMQSRLESALSVDPDHDGARLLLACLLLEKGRFLSALLQLAPLRDHHPHVGELVLLSAAAYSNLDLHDDALRMLSSLDIDESHPSYSAAAAIASRARTGTGQSVEGSLQEPLSENPSQMLS
jgi:hypothetical protein